MCLGQPLFDDTDDIKDLFWKEQRQYRSKTSLPDLKKVFKSSLRTRGPELALM